LQESTPIPPEYNTCSKTLSRLGLNGPNNEEGAVLDSAKLSISAGNMNRDSLVWKFIRNDDGAWSWQKVANGESQDSSGTFRDYGWVVQDAISHGFRPKSEPWVIMDRGKATTFKPQRGHRVRHQKYRS